MTNPVGIVGASIAGLRTAEALRRFGYHGPVTVIGEEPWAPYNRPPLSKEVLATEVSHEVVAFAQREATSDVEWALGQRIVSADLANGTVTAQSGRTWRYSSLVIATGLRPRRLAQVAPRAGRYALRTLEDAIALRAALVPGARVVIAGAGFIGCEVAATARKLGCEVTVVGSAELPLQRSLGTILARRLMARHLDHGVRFELGARVAEILGSSEVAGVRLSTGTELSCDVLVEAIGSHDNTEWLAGEDLDLTQGVRTDGALRALRHDRQPWANVYAVGDLACFPNPLFDGLAQTVQHWNIATETGRRAGRIIALQLAGDEPAWAEAIAEPFAPVPSFWSDQYDLHLLAYGLPVLGAEAEVLDGDPDGDCVIGYFRDDRLVGAAGIGAGRSLHRYRSRIGASRSELATAGQR